nr:immunoglobulin heavy chain junction region [Macaca mulatta]MOV38874.1 immunoglobulin heavy chain junction region [Macaca mulatta]MOV39374.1 immunoglobulin heavy chain junction region [Macaca mulatta]MOV39975.1 immunoglobulin heavy chain junction region [Macaca mulatta]MOV42453.1 immunoglobulin heavy chain junction region [Macaca mulatta]
CAQDHYGSGLDYW